MEITVSDSKNEKKNKLNLKSLFAHTLIYIVVTALTFVGSLLWFNSGNWQQVLALIQSSGYKNNYETFKVSLPKGLSVEIQAKLKSDLERIRFNDTPRFEIVEQGDLKIHWVEGSGVYTEYVVPVAHFYTITDDFNPSKQKVFIDSKIPEEIQQLLIAKYPSAKVTDDITKSLDEAGKNIVLIQADNLSFDQKLLKVDGKYFLDDKEGSLKFTFGLSDNKFVESIVNTALENSTIFQDQFTLDNVLTLNQTGVTAISRDVAFKIEASGDDAYPARKIANFLKSSDLTHISNEVSSAPGCVPAQSMRFCAKAEYLKTLTVSGADIISLTGNHNNDFGATNNLNTIKDYEKLGMKYFGGGKDEEDASKILYIEQKGTKLAFIGYNYYDTMLGTGALAAKDRAGANSYSVKKMEKDIKEAKSKADVVIVDFQFQECYSYPPSDVIYPICYKPLTSPDQRGTFQKAIDLGADIVVGVQAHQPQTYELYRGKPIFYGLGNLFFDQIEWIGTRQGLVLTHYFNEGKLIQTKINTTIYDAGMQPYVTKGQQRELLLNLLKAGRE